MSTSSVSSSRAHAISPEAIAAWNDLTVSAADGRVRVLTIETGSTKAQHNAPSGQPGQPSQMGPMPAAARPVQAANDAPLQHTEPSLAADARAPSQPADDATALLEFALGLCEPSASANPTTAAPEPGGAPTPSAQVLPAQTSDKADKPDAPASPSLATQLKGEPHAGVQRPDR